MNQKGIVQIIPVVVISIFIILTIFFSVNKNNLLTNLVSPTPTNTAAGTVTPTPTATPTVFPTAIALNTPIPTPLPVVNTNITIATVTPTPKPTSPPISGPVGAGYTSGSVQTEKGTFSATILTVDLNSARMLTDTGNDGDCGNNCVVMPLQNYVNRNGGFAGVNGTYFCPASYAECSGKSNSFDFPVYNSRLGRWVNGGNLSWNSRSMVYVDGGGVHYLQNANSFSGGLTAGIVNYPGLVNGGNVQIDDNQSGLSDKQKAVGTKVGIGISGNKKVMVVVAYKVNMQQFAYVFKALGASGAMNLDSGGSTALYYNGAYRLGPGRDLPNAIVFAR